MHAECPMHASEDRPMHASEDPAAPPPELEAELETTGPAGGGLHARPACLARADDPTATAARAHYHRLWGDHDPGVPGLNFLPLTPPPIPQLLFSLGSAA